MAALLIIAPHSVPDAQPSPTHTFGQPFGESIVDAALDIEPVGRDTGFAAVTYLGDQGTFDGLVQVGVVEDQERRVAAELH
jgi:hypothetical protein